MQRPAKLSSSVIDAWLQRHASWGREGDALVRAFRFTDFASSLSFAVALGLAAEKRDHHPEITIGWGRAKVTWTTHDAGGITELDTQLAEHTDAIFARYGS